MILIGAAKAGKTSLRQALMHGRSQLTAETERTWVMERHLWEPESRLRVQVCPVWQIKDFEFTYLLLVLSVFMLLFFF